MSKTQSTPTSSDEGVVSEAIKQLLAVPDFELQRVCDELPEIMMSNLVDKLEIALENVRKRESPQGSVLPSDDEVLREAQKLYPSTGVQDIHRATCLRWVFMDGAKFVINAASVPKTEPDSTLEHKLIDEDEEIKARKDSAK